MDCLGFSDKPNILEELKSNTMMPDYLKIKHYKDYLLSQANMAYPDAVLDFIAREKLELQRTQKEIDEIKKQFNEKMSMLEEQNKIGEEQVKQIQYQNKMSLDYI